MPRRCSRFCAVLLLALTFIPLPALAASPEGGLFTSLWEWLAVAWAEAGCILDPSGACAPSPDAGCGLNPDGRCAPAPSPDAGCGLDPSGVPCSEQQ